MKVLVLTKYSRMGASSRLRTMQYLPLLKNLGFQFTVKSLFDDSYLKHLYDHSSRSKLAVVNYYFIRLRTLLTIGKYDIVWIEGEVFPYMPALVEQLLFISGIKYIVDYDDAIFHNYDLSKNKFIKIFLSKKIDKVMKNSSCVIAGNSYLAERAKLAGAKQIKLIPTVVDHHKYKKTSRLSRDILTIGWIGSPSTQRYVIDIATELQKIYKKHPFRLLLVGATSDAYIHFPKLDVDIREWNEETEIESINDMDIGIMPLKDGPWEKGKCGYKLIQYMACGVPVVASDVGVNRSIIENEESGFLVNEKEEWVHLLLRLLESPALRHEKGENGREIVIKKYSIESQVTTLTEVLSKI